MKNQVKKEWNKPSIKATLEIKQTLARAGRAKDGGPVPNATLS